MRLRLKEDPREWRRFAGAAAVFGLVLTALGSRSGRMSPEAALGVAVGVLMLLAAACVWPRGMRPVYRGAMTVSFAMGQGVGRVFLGVFFFALVTPLGLLLRGLGKDPLHLRRRKDAGTYWHPARSDTPLDRLFGWLVWAAVVGAGVTGVRGATSGLVWTPNPQGREAAVSPGAGGRTGFTLLAPAATGLAFTNGLPESRHLTNQILLNGAGVAAGDVDGDGWCDLYFAASDGDNALFRNLGGWRFERVAGAGGAACSRLASTGAVLADLDGDRDLDLVVNTIGQGTRVFHNDGSGRFEPFGPVLNAGRGGMTLALADVDGDGFLDVYVVNYRTSALMDMPNARVTFKRVGEETRVETLDGRSTTAPDLTNRFVVGARGEINEMGEPDVLYHNDGGRGFTAVAFTGGSFLDEAGQPLKAPLLDWGLSAMFGDLTGDGLPDLFVCNDFHTEDRLWINQGGGGFGMAPRLALRHLSMSSMAVDMADVDRDGHPDLFVAEMMSRDHAQRMRYVNDLPPLPEVVRDLEGRPQYGRNMLFVSQGDGTYAEVAQYGGVEAAEWAWSLLFLDVDLDGYEDLLVANGMERAARDLDVVERLKTLRAGGRLTDAQIFEARRMFPQLRTPKLAFRNRGDLTFEEVGAAWGLNQPGVSQGMALADLDQDGDLDLVLNNLNGAAGVYRNDTAAPRVAVRLRGLAPNTQGVGARIEVRHGVVPRQSQEIRAGGRYLSGDDAQRCFGAGPETNRLEIEVVWRSGRRSVLRGAVPNRFYELDEASAGEGSGAGDREPGREGAVASWFEDMSEALGHTHAEEPFDDFTVQPLLPRQLSREGPGVAWGDLDGDGHEDLVLAGGRGGRVARFRNEGAGRFRLFPADSVGPPLARDGVGVAVVSGAAGGALVLVSQANYEVPPGTGPVVVRGAADAGWVDTGLPAIGGSPGPMALADVTGDGLLDLLVGGAAESGRYPAPASSELFVGTAEGWAQGGAPQAALRGVGLVNGAVFSDVDGDGDPDLLLACEWGPVRLLINEGGRLVDRTLAWGLAAWTGWWNGVATGDFDEDGRPDVVASNWGRNTGYQAHRSRPLELAYGDFDGDRVFELVEAQFDVGLGKMVPRRQLGVLARSLPFLAERYPSNRSFSRAGLEEMLGERRREVTVLSAACLETSVFLNRGGRFEVRALPAAAQMAPAFGVCVGDADGDGHVDVFLAQNFFGVAPGENRLDAGRGLWLRGDGRGAFAPVSAEASGVRLYGEGRGAALADLDEDGRLDLVVGQNGTRTGLFRNRGGAPGIRVRLRGGAANRGAVGAALRVDRGNGLGAVQEWQAGSGRGSQDGAVKVIAATPRPVALWVRWPGGREARYSVPSGVALKTIEVDLETGRLNVAP